MIFPLLHRRSLLACALLLASAPLSRAQSGTIAGVVVSATSDAPLARAAVQLHRQSDGSLIATEWTGDDGRFRFEHLDNTKYELSGVRTGFLSTAYEQHGNFSSAVVVGPDQPTEALTLRMNPEATLRGTVTGAAGEPVEEATVTLFRQPDALLHFDKILRIDSRKTDDTGSYEFAHLEPGNYLIAVGATPWFAIHSAQEENNAALRSLDRVYPLTYYGDVTDEAQAAAIPLAIGEIAHADLHLAAVPSLHIQLPPGTFDDQHPATLRQNSFGTYFGENAAAQQEHDGFGAVAPGRYLLSAGNPARQTSVTLSASGAITLADAEPLVSLKGHLVLAGSPAPEHSLQLNFYPEPENSNRKPTWLIPGGNTFHIENLLAGRWRLELTNGYGHAYTIDSIEAQGKRINGNRLTLAGGPAEITLHAHLSEQRIEGFALKQGHGVAGAMVLLIPEDLAQLSRLARRDQSDSDGSFALHEVVPGRYTLVAIENGWDLDWRSPEAIVRYLPAGQRVTVEEASSQTLHRVAPVELQPR